MSRNISWIREIWNNTATPVTVWCWDTDNEGEYFDFNSHKEIGVNDGGNPITFQAGEHVVTSGGSCGVPDGGDKDGWPKRRVFFTGSPGANFEPTSGPGRGLRINRTSLDDQMDQILYTDERTGTFIGRMKFPQGIEQTLNVVINTADKGGIVLNVVESSISTEAKWDQFVADTEEWLASNAIEIAKLALQAAEMGAETGAEQPARKHETGRVPQD
jgi:hypothetical protein